MTLDRIAFYNSGSSRSEQIAEINVLQDVKQGTFNGRNNGFNKFDQKETSRLYSVAVVKAALKYLTRAKRVFTSL